MCKVHSLVASYNSLAVSCNSLRASLRAFLEDEGLCETVRDAAGLELTASLTLLSSSVEVLLALLDSTAKEEGVEYSLVPDMGINPSNLN